MPARPHPLLDTAIVLAAASLAAAQLHWGGGIWPSVWLIFIGCLFVAAWFVRERSRILDGLIFSCRTFSRPASDHMALVHGLVLIATGVAAAWAPERETLSRSEGMALLARQLERHCPHGQPPRLSEAPAGAPAFTTSLEPAHAATVLHLEKNGTALPSQTECRHSGQAAIEFVSLGQASRWPTPVGDDTGPRVVLSAARMGIRPFDTQGRPHARLTFYRFSTSNQEPRDRFNCGTSLDVHYRLSGGPWQHKMAFCGQHVSETSGWRQAELVFDLNGSPSLEISFTYGSLRPSPEWARFFVDDVRLELF